MMSTNQISLEEGELRGLIGGVWTHHLDVSNQRIRLELLDDLHSPYLARYKIKSGWVELTNWDDCWVEARNLDKRYRFYQKRFDSIPIERINEFTDLRLLGAWEEDSVCGFNAAVDHPDYTNVSFYFENTQFHSDKQLQPDEYNYPEIENSFETMSISEQDTRNHEIQQRALNSSEIRNLAISVDGVCIDEDNKSLSFRSKTGWIYSDICNHLGECSLEIHSWSSLSTFIIVPGPFFESRILSSNKSPLDTLRNPVSISRISPKLGGSLEFNVYLEDSRSVNGDIRYRFRNCKWSLKAQDLDLRL